MARPDDSEDKRPRKKGTSFMAWILVAMLIAGLGGFGVTSFSGGVTSIGRVGDSTISVNDYARAVRQEANAFSQQIGMQLGVAEALAFGLDKQALANLVTRAALDNEARRVGVSVGDQAVAGEITAQAAFQGLTGTFDRDTYRLALTQSGWSEQEYETAIRGDLGRSLLQGAVTGGFGAPQAMIDTMYRYIAERRGFSMIVLGEGDLATPVADPDDAALRAHYDANIDAFTRPEAKRIAYALLLPDMIADAQPVDDAVLQQLYQDRIDEFVQPERRLVERLVYPDAAARDAALASFAGGAATFEALVEERGLTLETIDMGDVTMAELGAAGEAVFAAGEGSVVAGETDLGPALFRVNGILEGSEVTFDEARADLASDLQMDAARREIADKVEAIDDLLAGGATLQDLSAEMGMEFATLDHVTGQQGDEPVEGYQAFREAADAVAEGDFAQAIVLEDGGVVALEFVETVPAAPIPFDEARDAVAESWRAATVEAALSEQALAFKAAVEAGASLGSLGIVDVTPEIARDGFVEDAPASLMTAVFGMQPGEVRVIQEAGFVALVRLDAVYAAAEDGDEAEALKAALAAQIEQALATDAMQAFGQSLQNDAGIYLDEAAIAAVNTSLQ